MAADEAVKATNSELILCELPRDTKGQGGHGCLLLFGADDVSDARRAVEITLRSLGWTFGDIYINDAGFIELQYSARASHALSTYLNAHLGKAFGLIVGCPAAVGVFMADTAIKAASVEIVLHGSPGKVTSHSNEFMIMISGDSGAVKQAVMAGREAGIKVLSKMGDVPQNLQDSYIK
jgi:microcompartment protein PduB